MYFAFFLLQWITDNFEPYYFSRVFFILKDKKRNILFDLFKLQGFIIFSCIFKSTTLHNPLSYLPKYSSSFRFYEFWIRLHAWEILNSYLMLWKVLEAVNVYFLYWDSAHSISLTIARWTLNIHSFSLKKQLYCMCSYERMKYFEEFFPKTVLSFKNVLRSYI